MKIVYCIVSIFTAFVCGASFAKQEWLCAIFNFIFTFVYATLYVIECNRGDFDDNVES